MTDFNIPQTRPLELGGTTLDVSHFLKADYTDVSLARDELPAIIEWLNEQLQSLYEQKLRAKCELKRARARAKFRLRGDGDGSFAQLGFNGNPTAEAIKDAAELDEEVVKADNDFAVLAGWVLRLTGTMASLESKLDLVRTTEATRRRVFQGDAADEDREEAS